MPPRSQPTQRTGAVAVETAILTPPLLLLTLLGVDFGRVYRAEMIVRQAAHAGASYAATHNFNAQTRDDWRARVEAEVTLNMQDLRGFDAQQLATSVTTFDELDGSFRVEVEVAYPFATVIDWPGLPAAVDLESASHFRRFQ